MIDLKWMDFAVQLGISLLIVLAGFVIGPLVRAGIIRLSKTASDKWAMTFIGSACNLSVKAIAIVIALQHLGVEMLIIVGAFSAMGLGISLALKSNMANVAAGLQIILTTPFKVHDFVRIDTHEGRVIKIETMFTTLLTPDNQEVVIPNLDCVTHVVKNFSSQPNRRVYIKIPVALDCDVAAFCKEIVQIAQEDERILRVPAPSAVMTDFMEDGSGILIGLYCHTSFENYWDVLYDLNAKIQKKRLDMHIESCSRGVVVKSAPNV